MGAGEAGTSQASAALGTQKSSTTKTLVRIALIIGAPVHNVYPNAATSRVNAPPLMTAARNGGTVEPGFTYAGGLQMLISPRPDSDSAKRLAHLDDPELARRLRKDNPDLFSTTRRSHVKVLTLAAIVSILAGYFAQPYIFGPHRAHAVPITRSYHITSSAAHHFPAPPMVAPSRVRTQYVIPVRTKHIVVEPLPVRIAEPQKQTQRRAAVAVAQENAQARARDEAKYWLQAQEQARAQDRARATEAAAATAAAQPKVAQTVTAPQPPDTGQTVPGPVGNTPPRVPTGGCRHGRWISIGGHGIAGGLLNFVLQNVHVKGMLPGRP